MSRWLITDQENLKKQVETIDLLKTALKDVGAAGTFVLNMTTGSFGFIFKNGKFADIFNESC